MITVGFNKVFDKSNVALGNHLFQYVICRLVAEKRGYNFFIPEQGYINEVFTNVNFGTPDGNILHYYQDSESQFYNPSIFEVQDFTHLTGFFQSEKYFKDDEQLVKSWLALEMDEETQTILQEFSTDTHCYIHIRGGDNVGKSHNWLAPKEYYSNAMTEIKDKHNIKNFCIVTDDFNLSKEWFPDIPIISKSLSTDFKLIHYSKYSIISNSTFSWWASWLGENKIIIAPDRWLNYNKPECDFFPYDIKSEKFTYL
jgi:hypothetical protein